MDCRKFAQLVLFICLVDMAGCGGNVDVTTDSRLTRASEDVGHTRRVLAIDDDSLVRVVSFDDPASPHEHSLLRLEEDELGYTSWTLDSSRLALQIDDQRSGTATIHFASSPNWGTQSGETLVMDRGGFSTWIGSDRYLVANPGQWTVSNLVDSTETSGPLPKGEPKLVNGVEWPALDIWQDRSRPSVVVQSFDGYLWFRESDMVELSSSTRALSFDFQDERLLGVVEQSSAPRPPDDSNAWFVGTSEDQECLGKPDGETETDCRVYANEMYPIQDGLLALILTHVSFEDARKRTLYVARWGAGVVLGTDGTDSRALYRWETSQLDFSDFMVGKWLYLLPSVFRWPKDGFPDAAPVVRVDTSLPFGDMKAEVVATVEMPGRPDAGARGLVRGGCWFSTVRGAEGIAPRRWQKLDLRNEELGDWQDTGFRGEYTRGLGERGLLFYDLGGSPFNANCDPCRYVAVEDVLDPQGRWMEGFFEQAPPHHEVHSPIRGVPDGSGVLIKNGDVLEYRHFDRPDVHFPLARLTEDSRVILPYSWNLDWYDEH